MLTKHFVAVKQYSFIPASDVALWFSLLFFLGFFLGVFFAFILTGFCSQSLTEYAFINISND